jgi:hypothetical protein
VGIEPGKLALRIPAGWDRLRVENLRQGGLYDLDWSRRRSGKETTEILKLAPHEGSDLPELVVERTLPLGAMLLGGGSPSFRPKPGREAQALTLRYRGGIEVVPLREPLRSGERSSRLRILDERLEGRTYVARLEGRRGWTYRLRVLDGEPRDLEVSIPEGPGDWGSRELRIEIRE